MNISENVLRTACILFQPCLDSNGRFSATFLGMSTCIVSFLPSPPPPTSDLFLKPSTLKSFFLATTHYIWGILETISYAYFEKKNSPHSCQLSRGPKHRKKETDWCGVGSFEIITPCM